MGMGRVTCHIKAFSVVIRTAFKSVQKVNLVSGKTGFKLLIFSLNSSERREQAGLQFFEFF